MKAENSTRIQFDSLSSNEAYARGVHNLQIVTVKQ